MDCSPFSLLSAELRNEIYILAVSVPKPIILRKPVVLHSRVPRDRRNSYLPGILQCCRQIRRETFQLYHACNSFHLRCDAWRSDDSSIDWVHEWLDGLGKDTCKILNSVNIDLGRHNERLGHATLPLEQRQVIWQAHQIAPRVSCIASRIPLHALSISSSWLVEQYLARTLSVQRRSLVEARKLRLFDRRQGRLVPYINLQQGSLRNSKISDILTASLVGNGRAILVILVHSIWLHIIHTLPQASQQVFDEACRSLEQAFLDIDDESARRAVLFLPDQFRGYPVRTEAYDQALDHASSLRDFHAWVREGEEGTDHDSSMEL